MPDLDALLRLAEIRQSLASLRSAADPSFQSNLDQLVASLQTVAIDVQSALAKADQAADRYSALFNNHHSVMLLIDPDTGNIVDANPAACQYYGYAHAELVDMRISDFNVLPPEEVKAEMQRARQFKKNYFDFRHRLANGEIRDVEVRSGAINWGGHQLLYSIIHDVTDRRRAEAALQRSEEKYRRLFNSAQVGIFRSSIQEGQILEANQKLAAMFGYDTAEEIKSVFLSVAHYVNPADRARLLAELKDDGTFGTFEIPFKRQDGSLLWVLMEAHKDTATHCIEGVMVDITAHRRTVDALIDSEVRNRSILDVLAEGIILQQRTGGIIFANAYAEQILGLPHAQVLGRTLLDPTWRSILPDGSPCLPDLLPVALTLQTGKSCRDVIMGIHKPDGTLTWISVNTEPMFRASDSEPYAVVVSFIDVTELFRAEQRQREINQELEDRVAERTAELHASETRYRNLIEDTVDWVWQIDQNDRYVYTSPQVRALRGYEPHEILGKTPFDLMPADEARRLRPLFDELKGQRVRFSGMESRVLHADGREVILETNGAPVIGGGGEFWGYRGIARDITLRKHAEEALRQSEARYRGLIESQTDLIVRVDSAGHFTYVNDAYCRKFGQTRDALLRGTFMPLVHPDDLASTLKAMEGLNVPPYRIQVEQRAKAVDGWRWFAWEDYAIHDEHGTLIEIQSVGRDITDRKQAEVALRESEALYHTLVETLPMNIFRKDIDGRFIFGNSLFFQTSGRERSELLGQTDFDLHPAELAEKYRADDERIMASGQSQEIIETHQTLDRPPIYVQTIKTPIYDTVGNLLGIQGVFWDVTQQRRADISLRESEALYRALFDGANDAIFMHQVGSNGLPGDILAVNDVACDWLEYTHDELMRAPLDAYDAMENVEQIPGIVEQIKTHGHATFERLYHTRTGRRFPVEINASRFEFNGKSVYLSIMRDITQRKRAEEVLYHALEHERELNQLKTQFVSMVSHEFRAPLTAIQSTSELLMHYSQRFSEDKKQGYLERIQTAVKRMTTMLDEVLVLGRAESGRLEFNPAPIDLEWFCRALVDEFQVSTGDAYTLDLALSGECAEPNLDENLVRHILTNLLSNAIKYSPNGGTIDFSVACNDRHVIFTVTDHGIGIPADAQVRLFQTFYRASNVGSIQGTGLGLAIVKHAVELHGGTISFESGPTHGTTFTVKLPLSDYSHSSL
ncbi:MAG: PAS domain S-box protein [Anaerolineae bacterium]